MEQIPFGKVSWFCHLKKVRISGTEDMAEYKAYLFHIRQSCIGMLLSACLSAGRVACDDILV